MKYKSNWEASVTKFKEYWAMENSDRPVIGMQAVNEKVTPQVVSQPDRLYERWTNVDYHIGLNRSFMERTLYMGDTFPSICPNI